MSLYCVNDLTRTYKGTEPSPKGNGYCAHAEPEGKIQIGKDTKIWQVKNGRWVKLKYYETHDNGGRPFLVVLLPNNHVQVYNYKAPKYKFDKKYYENIDKKNFDNLVGEYKAKRIIIGTSSGTVRGADHEPNTSDYFKGNSILLQMNNKEFIHIGSSIYRFSLEDNDEFYKYYSMVGLNDVPYPVLVGKQNVYFLIGGINEYKYIPRAVFPKDAELEDAYYYYYGHNRLDDPKTKKPIGKSLSDMYAKNIKHVKIIEKRRF
jgi:hypothetical protein